MIDFRNHNSFFSYWILVLTSLLLYAYHITDDLYSDELGHTYKLITDVNFWAVLRRDSIIHPPLYFVLAKASYLTVHQPWSIRLPSIISAIGVVIMTPWLARRILGVNYFLPSAMLVASSPFLLEFAAEGRSYAMIIFLSLTLAWFFINFMEEENISNMVFLSIVALGGALTHYFFSLQLVSAALYYIATKRRLSPYSIGALLIVFAVLLPVFIWLVNIPKEQYAGYVQDDWATTYFSPFNFFARLMVSLNFGFSTFNLPPLDPGRNFSIAVLRDNLLMVNLTAIALIGLAFGMVRATTGRIRYFWFFAVSFTLPLAIGILAGLSGRTLLREKHLAAIWAPYFFLMLVSFGSLAKSKFGYLVIGSYACVVLVSLFHFIFLPNDYSRRMDWTGLNGVLSTEAEASDVILFYSGTEEYLSLGKLTSDKLKASRMSVLTDKPEGETASDFAKALNATTKGRIYLVNHEEQRLMVDPNMETIKTLRALRETRELRFGRNLVLYVFTPITQPGGGQHE